MIQKIKQKEDLEKRMKEDEQQRDQEHSIHNGQEVFNIVLMPIY